jgi:hypothetical protein
VGSDTVGIMPTHPAQRTTPAADQLVEMLAVRRQLSAEKTAAENASRLLEDLMLQRLSRHRIARLAADIELLDKRLVETPRAVRVGHEIRGRTAEPNWQAARLTNGEMRVWRANGGMA